MSLYHLILWNQVDILQKHFKTNHVHMRLWTRFYGIRGKKKPYSKHKSLIMKLPKTCLFTSHQCVCNYLLIVCMCVQGITNKKNYNKLHLLQRRDLLFSYYNIYELRTKTTLYLFLRGNKSLLYHQIGNRNFFIFITIQWNLMFCVDKIKYGHLAILSNLKSCQFAPRIVIFNLCICCQFAPTIVIFNLCICCQFEDLQIISPKIIPMSHRNI